MDQIKIGKFINELRKGKNMTQQQLGEKIGVSPKTISKWETGKGMPDLSSLKPLSDCLEISINELLSGERIEEERYTDKLEENIINTIEYSDKQVNDKKNLIGFLLIIFGVFISFSAMSIFASESSWGSIYSVLGSFILTLGVYLIVKSRSASRSRRILSVAVSVALLFGLFTVSDYVAVKYFNQVPRFRYQTVYDSRNPDQLIHKTLFYTVIQKNPGTEYEEVEIVK